MATIIGINELVLDNTIKIVPANGAVPEHYAADNSIFKARFHQIGNRVEYETSSGHLFVWTPKDMKYVDAFGMEDVIYDVQDAPLETKAFYARFNRTYPDVDDLFVVENDRLKHNIIIQGFQRDPFEFLESPIEFVISGTVEFDPSTLTIFANGIGDQTHFETEEDIKFLDSEGNVVFDLPKIVACDSRIEGRAMTTGKYRGSLVSPGVLDFSIVLTNDWMSSLDRVYPVVIDPTVVVSFAHDTSGNGGRKLVRLSNGWLIAAASEASSPAKIRFYKSADNGITWTELCYIQPSSSVPFGGFAVASSGTNVYVVATWDFSDASALSFMFDATTVTIGSNAYNSNRVIIDNSSQAAVGSVSLCIDGTGALHAAWASQNGTDASLNIRYSKSTNGGATWASPTQITTDNASGINNKNPCVVVKSNNYPVILYEYASSSAMRIDARVFNGTSWEYHGIYNGGTYAQSNPCAAVDGNDVIHVVWCGFDSTDNSKNNIRYSKSTDGGATWSSMLKLTSGNTYDQLAPSITIDNSDKLYVFWYGIDPAVSSSYQNLRRKIFDGSSWGAITTITNNTSGHARYVSTLWSKFNMNSTDAIRWIYQDTQDAAVKYDYISLNTAPNAPTGLTRANFDATQASTFTWTFSDPDAGNTQSAYELEICDTANPSTPVVTVPKTGSTQSSHTLSAGTLQNGKTYQWRVKTYDQNDASSPWSSYATFKCSATPTATVTDPTAGATITTDSYTFAGSYVQANGVAQQSFQFKLWDAAGTTLLQDSGEIIGTSNMKTFIGLANNTSYKIEFIVTSQDGVSASSGKIAFSVAYTPPATPIVTATNESATARVRVDFTNPAPSGGQPAVASNNVYRRKVGETEWKLIKQGATAPYYDYTCPAGQYEYGVTALSANGAVSAYGTAQVTSSFVGQWLIDEADPNNSVQFLYNQDGADIETQEDVAEVRTFAKYPRIRRGVARYRSGTLSALYLSSDGDILTLIDKVDAMASSDKTYLLKLNNGRIYRVALSGLRNSSRYGNAAANVSVKWTEVGDV